MAHTKETALVAAIKRAILARYPSAWVFKVVGHPYQESGIPDLLVCVQGHLFGLEVKLRRPGESEAHARERASDEQSKHIAGIRAAGGTALVILSADEALSAIAQTCPRRAVQGDRRPPRSHLGPGEVSQRV